MGNVRIWSIREGARRNFNYSFKPTNTKQHTPKQMLLALCLFAVSTVFDLNFLKGGEDITEM